MNLKIDNQNQMRKFILKKWMIDLILPVISITAVLFILISKSKIEKNYNERIIEVIFWSPINTIQFDTTSGPYKKICLSGDVEKDSFRLIEIREYLNHYKNRYTTAPGMHVVFDNNSKYGEFIKVLDYCLQNKIKLYAPYKNNIWIPTHSNMNE